MRSKSFPVVLGILVVPSLGNLEEPIRLDDHPIVLPHPNLPQHPPPPPRQPPVLPLPLPLALGQREHPAPAERIAEVLSC